ncbi:TRAP transporter small permease [Aliiruegeria sabulilitoris]|uniref:TRAP transporter small permease n=1 Tax=Aliiruegeria sabulilitoris TaxID=1510458 RepID=UPI00082D114F|nr:TRAP transporter small permease [Aliiruegeria sabulilitoris]NDR58985.1 TRAP transporter small permease [Pseudoruegeria sp. M32A2M]
MTNGDAHTPAQDEKGRQRPFLPLVTGISTLLDWSGRIIAAVCLGVTFATLLVNVILRYAFGSGIAWAYEIHAILLPWMVGGGIVIAAARGRNIAITLMPDMLPQGPRRILSLAINITILVISVSVLDASGPILKAAKFQTLSTLGIKQYWGYLSLFYAFAGMSVIAVVDIIRTLAGEDLHASDYETSSLS